MSILRLPWFVLGLILAGGYTSAQPASVSPIAGADRIAYPSARKSDTSEQFHAVVVQDPYRWMEDIHSKELAAWVAAQNGLSTHRLDHHPAVVAAREHLERAKDVYTTREPGREAGGRTFFRAYGGGQIQLMTQDPGGVAPRALVDVLATLPDTAPPG